MLQDRVHGDDLYRHLVFAPRVVRRNYKAPRRAPGFLGEPHHRSMIRVVRRDQKGPVRPRVGRRTGKQNNVGDDGTLIRRSGVPGRVLRDGQGRRKPRVGSRGRAAGIPGGVGIGPVYQRPKRRLSRGRHQVSGLTLYQGRPRDRNDKTRQIRPIADQESKPQREQQQPEPGPHSRSGLAFLPIGLALDSHRRTGPARGGFTVFRGKRQARRRSRGPGSGRSSPGPRAASRRP
jgi:hypothetical protein